MFPYTPWLKVQIKEGRKLPTFVSRTRQTAENLKPAAFDPRSVDIDSDGWHQEGTTARWFGIGVDNPLYKKLKKAVQQEDNSSEDSLIEAARRAEDLWGAPDPLSSTLEADLSWVGGWQTQYARGAPITDAAITAGSKAIRGRELLRKRGERADRVPNAPDVTEPVRAETEVAQVAEEVQSVTRKLESSAKDKIAERLKREQEIRKKSQALLTDEQLDEAKNFDPFDFDAENGNGSEYDDFMVDYMADNPQPYWDPIQYTDEENQSNYDDWLQEFDQAWDTHHQDNLSNADKDSLISKVSDIFNFEFETKDGKKFSLSVDDVNWDDSSELQIEFIIYDEKGNPAGSATRTLDFDTKVVAHDVLKVNKDHRGSGISSVVNSRNEQIYAAMGMERIHVGALSSPSDYNGVTHWPKVGFDWEDESQRDSALDKTQRALDYYLDELKKNPDAMPTISVKTERNENGTIVVDFVDVPMFSSHQEAEELSQMILQARQEGFDAEERLTALEFVQWPGAEAWFKRESNTIDYSRTIAPLEDSVKEKSVPSAIQFKYEKLTEANRSKKKSVSSEIQLDVKGLASIVPKASDSGKRVLKPAAYDPDAHDGDGDGIVQEGTAWERPIGTRFLHANGHEFDAGIQMTNRPAGGKLVDSGGKSVDYVPTYDRPDYKPVGSTIGETQGSIAKPKLVKKIKNLIFKYYKPGEKYDQTKVYQAAKERKGEIRESLEIVVEGLSDEDLMKARKALKLLPSLDVDASRGDDDQILIREAIVDHLFEDAVARLVDYVNNRRRGDLYIAVPPNAVSAILRAKRMKSQFETGTSGGLLNPEWRRRVEDELLSIPEDLPDKLRPIYGFQLGEFEGDSPTESSAAYHYGVVVFRLKSSVRERTTMTNADSLDYKTDAIPVDGDLPEDRILAAVGWNDFEIGEAVNGALSGFREGVLGEDGSDDLVNNNEIAYSEIQVHGGVDMEDIEEVIYPSSTYSLDIADRQRIIRELDSAGIKHREDR